MEPREYDTMFSLEERHWWYRGLRRQIFRAALRAGRPSGIGLDAGCGTGMNLVALARELGPMTWIGLDDNAQALTHAAGRGLRHLTRASVEALPVGSRRVDLLVSADVLYHRGVGDDVAALVEMERCLKPGGYLILNLPAFDRLRSAHDAAIHTARRYTRGELVRKLRRAGLTPVRVRYWNWLLFPPLALVRLVRGREQGATRSDLAELPGWINRLLDALLALEARVPIPMPAGLSILALARRDRP